MCNLKLNILFRTAGGRSKGTELGTGHLFRCINLQQRLKNHKAYFLIEDYENAKKILKSNSINHIITLKKNITVKNDIHKTKLLIKNKNIDLIIVDKFKTEIKYLREINKIIKVVYVSDLWKINFPADLVINGFIGFKNSIKKNKYNSRCLLGPNYQILNKEFNNRNKIQEKKYDVLVTFGGYDEHNIIEIFCKAIINLKNKSKIKIIVGPAAKNIKKIYIFKKKFQGDLSICRQTNSMFNQLAVSRIGICSGGITSYEFAAFNHPFAIICQHKHQLKTAKIWQQLGFAKNLGMPKKSTANDIEKFLTIHANKRKYVKRKIVDGNGTLRIEKEILRLFKK